MLKLTEVVSIIRNVFTAPSTLEKSRLKPNFFTRIRKLPFSTVLSIMLCMFHESTQKMLNKFFDDVTCSQQAFSKSRHKFTEYPFVRAFECVRNAFYSAVNRDSLKAFHNYHLFAIDGSSFALPDLKSLLSLFGGTGRNADSPTARASIVYDLLNKFIVDADIQPLTTDERTMALKHILSVKDIINLSKSIFIMDRGYPSEKFMRELLGITNFVMRVKSGFNKTIDNLSIGDHSIVLYQGITIRILKFKLNSGEIETLITNVNDIPFDEFKKLYFMRWGVEIVFDILKNKLEITNWNGWSEICIRQEFFLGILLSNVVSIAEREAAEVVNNVRKQGNKHKYKPNITNIVSALKEQLSLAVFASSNDESLLLCQKILTQAAYQPVPIRPGRSFTRNNSPRNTKYYKSRKSPL